MRDYGTVAAAFWTGKTGKALRSKPNAQRLAIYLMTAPSAEMTGLYYIPLPTICHEVGLSPSAATTALGDLAKENFCHYDHETETIWVVEMAKWQVADKLGEKDNRIKCIQKSLGKMHKSPFVKDFIEKYGDAFRLSQTTPFGPPSDPLQSQEQEPVQEPEQHNTGKGPVPSGAFKGVTTETLEDTSKLMSWHDSAAARKRPLVADTASDRLFVVGAAVRALELGDNPPAFFASIVSDRTKNKNITQAQEDRARARLKAWQARAGPPTQTAAVVAESLLAPSE